jgi:hypothetical protein
MTVETDIRATKHLIHSLTQSLEFMKRMKKSKESSAELRKSLTKAKSKLSKLEKKGNASK